MIKTYNPKIHHRRSIRLKKYNYSSNGAYFITICTYKHEYLFGEIKNGEMNLNVFGEVVRNYWLKIKKYFSNVILDEFIIMPNHFHGIVIIDKSEQMDDKSSVVGAIHELPLHKSSGNDLRKFRRNMLLPKIIGRFKMQSAKQINILRKTKGVPVWQRNYYEHIIRDENDYYRIVNYIKNNPSKWEDDKYFKEA